MNTIWDEYVIKVYNMYKYMAFFLTLAAAILFLGNMFNPFNQKMFDFHDETQPARVAEFTFNLQHLQIPPRLAPHFSFNMGFPVFNYYSPFSYWVTSFINLLGFGVADSIKLSFLLALVLGFIGMYLYLRIFFSLAVSLLGASLFVSAPWLAVEIFVRGNLGEVWLISLIPWTLYILHKNSQEDNRYIFVLTVFILIFALTAHNILSLIFLPWIIVYIFLLKKTKKNYVALVVSLLASSYFLIPAVLESSWTQAASLAKGTNYADHFLCIKQIWTAPFWGYGGSAPGCESDGFSFMLGKIQLIVASAGSLIFLYDNYKKRLPSFKLLLLILILTVGSIFLTLYQAAFVWNLLSPLFSLFQFPWRFLAFAVFGNAVLGAYLFSRIKLRYIQVTLVVLAIVLLIYSSKYFTKVQMTQQAFNDRYLSQEYVQSKAAYAIREYLPKQADYNAWHMYKPRVENSDNIVEDSEYDKVLKANAPNTTLNILYTPFWHIFVDGQKLIPQTFDTIGRPIITTSKTSIIHITYGQTIVEKIANSITGLIILFLIALLFREPLWKKLRRLVNS